MDRLLLIAHKKNMLNKRYKELVEEAYNFRQTDSALSDISEYRAIKLLDKINKLKYLSRDTAKPA
ncbi:Lacal_2735 family protein [Seonamhaeicola algicola]|uniref:Lacal_2735 family protein n=2 Tax=Seonamhaeicola TaxID=1649495 RepID=A0A5C7ARS2_9FLAO|nr:MULTISPECIES: Lacal_2735 family protein [Seonamhaeicola]TXE11101.1 Lacal_2735 family protein [Seonamhaeicola algicola]TYA94137.1 Lacal_2735 family protein [Seonamhaeicola marinus]